MTLLFNFSDTQLKDYCLDLYNIDVKTLSEKSGIPRRTLNDWWRNESKQSAVKLMIAGLSFINSKKKKEKVKS